MALRSVDLPAFGRPIKPTSAIVFNSKSSAMESTSSPYSAIPRQFKIPGP